MALQAAHGTLHPSFCWDAFTFSLLPTSLFLPRSHQLFDESDRDLHGHGE